MASKIVATAAALSVLLSGVSCVEIVARNHGEADVNIGGEVDLICTANVAVDFCIFRSPGGANYPMVADSGFPRLTQLKETDKDCGMKISGVMEEDNGEWECSVTGTDPTTGQASSGSGSIRVVVAVPPAEVYLEANEERLVGPLVKSLVDDPVVPVDCVAKATRPRPEFKWFIGQTSLQDTADVQERDVDVGDDKKDYISTLRYPPVAKHSGQDLKCVVEHAGYSEAQLAGGENVATAALQLEFRPEEHKKETFFGMKLGESNAIRIKFRANPKPSDGKWQLGDVSVPIGAESTDQKFSSTPINDGDIEGEYEVELTIVTMEDSLAGKTFSLDVNNDLGTTTYQFELAVSAKPQSESGGVPIIGIVILIVIIIVVGGVVAVAKARGMLCFASASGEPLQEEKEGFDDPEKGQLTKSAAGDAKSSPEKKPDDQPKKPEDKDDKEDKKSNGGHNTPV